jgi:protein-arginine kinase activator protein McsA
MICEACHLREATVKWHHPNLDTGQEEHLQLCQECANAKTDPQVLEKIRAARARGETGAISGWTGYPAKPS